jgi:hypothetical protein
MMRDMANKTSSQQESKRGWFSAVHSAIMAGFEAYGSAQIGLGPGVSMANSSSHIEKRIAPTAASHNTRNRKLVQTKADPAPMFMFVSAGSL